MDIDNIFNSQFPSSYSISASPPLLSQKKPRCFQVPFRPKSTDQPGAGTKTRNNFPSQSEFMTENVSKIESFINQANGTSGQAIQPSFSRHRIATLTVDNDQNSFLPHKRAPVTVVPETPKPNKFASSSSDFNSGNPSIIEDSDDDEFKREIYGPCLQTPGKLTLPPLNTPGGHSRDGVQLRSVEELPHRYRSVFDKIPYFNIVQSKVFDDALYTDKSLVVCAPTGSGKTVVFELAIIRVLINNEELFSGGKHRKNAKPKIVYMAPIKALCTERHEDWSLKFHSLNLSCQELTGDTDVDEFWQLQSADIIFTTPEKWDSMTRRWRDNSSLVRRVKLFLIDEVHLLNDESRGATMEAVVSRMKTIQSSLTCDFKAKTEGVRFVAVSATIPNTEDIAEWLGSSKEPALSFSMDDSYRPVTLRKVVLGYPWSSNGSEFKFDISLNYKLGNVIQTYSENKPTLVFCATRKSVEQAAATLAKDLVFVTDAAHKQTLNRSANLVRNHRLRELLLKGIGYHHAGLDSHDRHITEDLFTQGDLLVLVSTSTLAMGVNLPAHLVVVKSTCHYAKGMFQEYSHSEILQMIGRAGRPQFDTSATAVIMTRNQSRGLYQNVVNGTQKIESSLHKHLIEHLNAEIVLCTIQDVTIALEWIRSTFLYIRLLKNPTHYGYPAGLTKTEAEKRLHELCMKNLDSLAAANLVSLDNELRLISNEPGRLMARYSIAFETIKKFTALSGEETLSDLVEVLSSCHEFQDLTLRMTERSALNKMNKDKNRVTVRYPLSGKIKTTSMKVNCLLQATLGCMTVQDFALTQDVTKIFRSAMRVTKCLLELQMLKNDFKLLHSSVILAKCAKSKLWENSRYVTKQLPNIGATLSSALANAGICSFEKLEETDPREIEMILNRHPPFGNHLREAVKCLPKYTVRVEQGKRYRTDTCDITVQVILNNATDLKDRMTAGAKHGCLLLIGDADNHSIMKQRLSDSQLMTSNNCTWLRTFTVRRATKGDELSVNLISQEWVGLDVESTYTPYYLGPRRMIATSSGTRNDGIVKESKYFDKKKKPCRHTCSNKMTCAHECCKIRNDGTIYSSKSNTPDTTKSSSDQKDAKFTTEHLQRFKYNNTGPAAAKQKNQVVPSTPSLQRTKGWEHLDSFCEFQQTQEVMDDEVVESMDAFKREQAYYEDQINLGSRIKINESFDSASDQLETRKRSLNKQLWTEDAPTQPDDVIVIEDDLAEIRPRVSKYGFKKKTPNKENTISDNPADFHSTTPTRMGKVFAWKSEALPKSSIFASQVDPIPERATQNNAASPVPLNSQFFPPNKSVTCAGPSTPKNVYPKPYQETVPPKQSNLPLPPYSQSHISQKINLKSFPVSSIQPHLSTNLVPESTHLNASVLQRTSSSTPPSSQWNPFSQTSTNSGSSNKIIPNSSRSFQPPGFSLKNDKNQRNLNQSFNNQLWEEAPSCAYPPPTKKRVTFFDNFPISQKLDKQPLPTDDDDISINCDFSLEDDDDDDLEMMEACILAEERENLMQSAVVDRIPEFSQNTTNANVQFSQEPSTALSCCSLPSPTSSRKSLPFVSKDRSINTSNFSSSSARRSTADLNVPVYPPLASSRLPTCSSAGKGKSLPQFFGSDSQSRPSTTKKASDIADAKKMFDSIFDGIF